MTPKDDATTMNDAALIAHVYTVAGKLDALLVRMEGVEREVGLLRPLLLERSGKEEELASVRKSLDEAHTRYRVLAERQDRMERRWYMLAGAFALLNVAVLIFNAGKGVLW